MCASLLTHLLHTLRSLKGLQLVESHIYMSVVYDHQGCRMGFHFSPVDHVFNLWFQYLEVYALEGTRPELIRSFLHPLSQRSYIAARCGVLLLLSSRDNDKAMLIWLEQVHRCIHGWDAKMMTAVISVLHIPPLNFP